MLNSYIFDENYLIGSGYIKSNKSCLSSSQVDLIAKHQKDNIVRVVECKWSNEDSELYIDSVLNKKIELKDIEKRLNFVVLSNSISKKYAQFAKDREVEIISLEDL